MKKIFLFNFILLISNIGLEAQGPVRNKECSKNASPVFLRNTTTVANISLGGKEFEKLHRGRAIDLDPGKVYSFCLGKQKTRSIDVIVYSGKDPHSLNKLHSKSYNIVINGSDKKQYFSLNTTRALPIKSLEELNNISTFNN